MLPAFFCDEIINQLNFAFNNTTAYGLFYIYIYMYKGADKSLARPGRKQATATEDFDFHVSYL
jgi:hypothetical protein